MQSNFSLREGWRVIRLFFRHDLSSIHMDIYDSLINFQKNNLQQPLEPKKYKMSESSSINQDIKFFLNKDPHWSFG